MEDQLFSTEIPWSNSTNASEINCLETPVALFPPAVDVMVTLMYSTVFATALCGNGLVLYVVASSPRMRSATNYMLLNLAIGDILMTLLCVPFTFVSTLLLQFWPFGTELCHTVSFSQAVSVLVSAYTLVAISVDRYLAIMWPLRPRLSRRHAQCCMGAVWMGALCTALPIPVFSKLAQPESWHQICGRWVCQEEWPSPVYRYYYSMALMTLQYLAPLCVLLYTYTSIAVVIWGKRTPGEAENSRDQRMARAKRKMIKMMVVVVAAYTVCWLPFNSLVVAWDNDARLGDWKGMPALWFSCHWLAMSHSCLNPLIYCWMNARFRDGYRAVLSRVPLVRRCVSPAFLHNGGHTNSSYYSVRQNSVAPANRRFILRSSCNEEENGSTRMHISRNGLAEDDL